MSSKTVGERERERNNEEEEEFECRAPDSEFDQRFYARENAVFLLDFIPQNVRISMFFVLDGFDMLICMMPKMLSVFSDFRIVVLKITQSMEILSFIVPLHRSLM